MIVDLDPKEINRILESLRMSASTSSQVREVNLNILSNDSLRVLRLETEAFLGLHKKLNDMIG